MILLTFLDLENPKIPNKFQIIFTLHQLISTPAACISRQDFFSTVFYFYLGGTDASKKSSRKVAFNIAFKGTNRCHKFLSSFHLSRKHFVDVINFLRAFLIISSILAKTLVKNR